MYARTVSLPHARYVRGFTLIEILIVIGMIAILATVVLIAINPLKQFAQARNSQRQANVGAILDAIGQRMAENKGIFQGTAFSGCTVTIPTTETDMSKSGFNIRSCLVPDYISDLPYDPSTGKNNCMTDGCAGGGEDYDTGYTVKQDSTTGRVTVCAPQAQESIIPHSTPFCLTR